MKWNRQHFVLFLLLSLCGFALFTRRIYVANDDAPDWALVREGARKERVLLLHGESMLRGSQKEGVSPGDMSLTASAAIGLQSRLCRNSVQGRHHVADDRGGVCGRLQLDWATGCCNAGEKDEPFSCRGCDVAAGCCDEFEFCISCCLKPNNTDEGGALQTLIAKQPAERHFTSVFDYCRNRCRSNSHSVVHENAYRSEKHHCFKDVPPPSGGGNMTLNTSVIPRGVRLLSGQQGHSCSLACTNNGMKCQAHVLPMINNCQSLQHFFTCYGGCHQSEGYDQPAEVDDDVPQDKAPGACLVNQTPAMFTCDGQHPLTRRLCPCG